jgi:superfamily II DNA or RNA helicase
MLAELECGYLDVITNCGVLAEGWDSPSVECCILARPTKHPGTYRQMVGRVLRPAEGKQHALILDHAGLTIRHGFVEDPIEWTLDETRRAATFSAKGHLTVCPECTAVMTAGKPCPECGWKRPPAEIQHREGNLVRLDRASEPRVFHAMLAHIALSRGYRPGWIAHKFKEKFKRWPNGPTPSPIAPSRDVLDWERDQRIAWAKQRASGDA